MKGYIVNKQRIFLCMGMMLAILGCWNIFNHATIISHIALEIDPSISDYTKQTIEQTVYTMYAQSNPNAQSVCTLIKRQFPCIKSVAVAYTAPNLVTIDCKACKPYCLLNYDFVLTAEAIPVHKNAFKKYELEHLHRIMLNAQLFNNSDILNACKECIAHLPNAVFAQYELVWNDSVQIWLHDKKDNFSVIFSKSDPPTISLLSQCEQIKHELQQKGVLQLKNNRWIADVRFSNQIIVNKGARGIGYG